MCSLICISIVTETTLLKTTLTNCVQVVGKFCMELAIKKAKSNGIGWVTCRGERVATPPVRYAPHDGMSGYLSL